MVSFAGRLFRSCGELFRGARATKQFAARTKQSATPPARPRAADAVQFEGASGNWTIQSNSAGLVQRPVFDRQMPRFLWRDAEHRLGLADRSFDSGKWVRGWRATLDPADVQSCSVKLKAQVPSTGVGIRRLAVWEPVL
jgi:hypothetical protein